MVGRTHAGLLYFTRGCFVERGRSSAGFFMSLLARREILSVLYNYLRTGPTSTLLLAPFRGPLALDPRCDPGLTRLCTRPIYQRPALYAHVCTRTLYTRVAFHPSSTLSPAAAYGAGN